MRATKGMADTTSGTIVAVDPMEVPTILRVNGMIATNRMMNGTDRSRFTKNPSTALSGRTGRMPSLSVTESTSPSGSPNRYARKVATSVIYRDSKIPVPSSLSI